VQSLFELPEPVVAGAPLREEDVALARALPGLVRLGTMSWSFAGWRGLVYASDTPTSLLSARGLTGYSQHPLLRAVEIDRSYYEPLPAEHLRAYAEQVPSDFRFLVKAHEACSVERFPKHARYGSKRGELNPLYLDASYAADLVVGPIVSGLGERLGAICFQFPPSEQSESPGAFADRLGVFLSRLPRGVPYAVELRNERLFGQRYVEALVQAGAVHCHNAWGTMPTVLEQARLVPPAARNPLIVRWLLAPGEKYEDARDRFRPFDRITREDLGRREMIARLAAKAAAHSVPVMVLINNKAEGCAPESAVRLAGAITRVAAAL